MGHKKLIAFIILINYFRLKVFCFVDYYSVQNVYNSTQLIVKNVEAKRNYMFKWPDFFDTHTSVPQLVVALPPQLRHRQLSALPTGLKIQVLDSEVNFRIRGASLMHQGFYTAFKVINNSIDGKAYHYVDEIRNFYINVIGLTKEKEECTEDYECESNICLNNTCVCNRDKPVLIDHKCYSAQPIGSKCFHTNQCRKIGGPNAECSHNGKCRCVVGEFSVELPHYGKYCIKPKNLGDNCIYSEECHAIGSNRYCNEDFRCHCIPGYDYRPGVGCKQPANSEPALIPSTYIWPLLTLTFVAYFH